MGTIAPALLPRARRRGRSVIVSKVAAATRDLGAFFILVRRTIPQALCGCYDSKGPGSDGSTPYPECARFPLWCNSPSPLLPLS